MQRRPDKKSNMALSDQDKIAVAREYFIRADQGRADVLDLLDEDAEIYFPKWTGGKTPVGRFCNVFKFRNDRIISLHIYLDPDYTENDSARFRWGKNRRW